jgi:Tfp pilus assembly protein PilW
VNTSHQIGANARERDLVVTDVPPPSRERDRSDEGFSLVDVLMSMVIASVVLAIFTTGTVTMYQAANRIDVRSIAQSQVSNAVLRLDKEIRYSAGFGWSSAATAAAAASSGVQQVQFLLTAASSPPRCVQVRVAGGLLRQREWSYPPASQVTASPWVTLASDIAPTSSFRYLPPDDTSPHQRLTLSLTAEVGPPATKVAKNTTITFTALNTTRSTGIDKCAEGATLP